MDNKTEPEKKLFSLSKDTQSRIMKSGSELGQLAPKSFLLTTTNKLPVYILLCIVLLLLSSRGRINCAVIVTLCWLCDFLNQQNVEKIILLEFQNLALKRPCGFHFHPLTKSVLRYHIRMASLAQPISHMEQNPLKKYILRHHVRIIIQPINPQ